MTYGCEEVYSHHAQLLRHTMASVMAAAPRSATEFTSFMSLPAELRNEIYGMVFDVVSVDRGIWPPLTQTNRQIRAESRPVFLHHTRISMSIHLIYNSQAWPPARRMMIQLPFALEHLQPLPTFELRELTIRLCVRKIIPDQARDHYLDLVITMTKSGNTGTSLSDHETVIRSTLRLGEPIGALRWKALRNFKDRLQYFFRSHKTRLTLGKIREFLDWYIMDSGSSRYVAVHGGGNAHPIVTIMAAIDAPV